MSSLKDDASLILIPSLYKDGRLDTVKPLGNSIVHPDATGNHDGTDGSTLPEANFTFSRGSNLAATRVDVNGLIEKGRENLLLQSNQFDTTWTTNNASVTSEQSGYDGSSDAWEFEATSTSSCNIIQNVSQSGVQNFSIYAKAGTTDWLRILGDASTDYLAFFDLTNGVVGATLGGANIDTNIESVGGGWYRCSISGNASITRVILNIASGNNDISTTIGDNIYIQDAQLEQGLVATDYIETGASTAQAGILEDMPRLDYSGGASCPSLLLEPQRANIIDQSEYFGAWTFGSGITLTHNYATSPEGIQNATLLARTTSGNVQQSKNITSGSTYAISVFAKTGTSSIVKIISTGLFEVSDTTFDLSDQSITTTLGSVVDADIEDYGNGWYRCWVTQTAASTGTGQVRINTGDNVNILLYGAQLEVGSYPTSYIPTYGSSVTRSFDNAGTRTDMQDFLGTDTGAWFMHLDEFYFDITGTGLGAIILAKNGQQATSIELVQDGNFQYKVTLNNSTALENLDGEDKLLMNWSSEFFKIFVNGVERYSSTSSQWSNAFTHLILPQTTRAPHIKIKQMLFFPTALTDSECIALTE